MMPTELATRQRVFVNQVHSRYQLGNWVVSDKYPSFTQEQLAELRGDMFDFPGMNQSRKICLVSGTPAAVIAWNDLDVRAREQRQLVLVNYRTGKSLRIWLREHRQPQSSIQNNGNSLRHYTSPEKLFASTPNTVFGDAEVESWFDESVRAKGYSYPRVQISNGDNLWRVRTVDPLSGVTSYLSKRVFGIPDFNHTNTSAHVQISQPANFPGEYQAGRYMVIIADPLELDHLAIEF